MSLISLLLVLCLIGVLAWALTTFLPMPANIKTLIVIVCGIVALLYVVQAFGLLGADIRVPRLH